MPAVVHTAEMLVEEVTPVVTVEAAVATGAAGMDEKQSGFVRLGYLPSRYDPEMAN